MRLNSLCDTPVVAYRASHASWPRGYPEVTSRRIAFFHRSSIRASLKDGDPGGRRPAWRASAGSLRLKSTDGSFEAVHNAVRTCLKVIPQEPVYAACRDRGTGPFRRVQHR